MLHRGTLLLVVCVLASVFVTLANPNEAAALPQGCPTGGTKITLRAGGASLLLDSSSDFRVQPTPGSDKFVVQASTGAQPVFKSDISIGPSTVPCPGNIASVNGDLQAYIQPDLRFPIGWTTLTRSPVFTTDSSMNPVTTLDELYQINTCGGPSEDANRVKACRVLDQAIELQSLREHQAANGAAWIHPEIKLGATAFYNKASDTISAAFGTVGPNGLPQIGLQQSRFTVILRSTPGDYGFRQSFLSYSLPSFDPISGAVYNTFNVQRPALPGTGALNVVGREFWISNYGVQVNDMSPIPDASKPSALILHYNCPSGTSTARNCDTVALLTQGDTLLTLGLTTTQPDPLGPLQNAPIAPNGFTFGAGSNLRYPQLVIDAQGQFHVFFLQVSATDTKLQYFFCQGRHNKDNEAGFTLSATDCQWQTLFTVTAVISDMNLQARLFNGTLVTPASIVVAAFVADDRRDTPAGNKAVRLFTFTKAPKGQPWTFTQTFFPPNQYPISQASTNSRFFFPNNGRMYDFHLAITDDDSSATKVAISYSYTRYANVYGNKRSLPGNPDRSREEFVFRTVLCPEFRCLSFTTRQLVGSRTLFHSAYGTVPRGLFGIISGSFNGGRPVFGFSVGSGDQNAQRAVKLPGANVAGGPIGVLLCQDDTCLGASLERSSDYLSGHRGDFIFAPTPGGVLAASLPVIANHNAPTFQSFRNPQASPTAQQCNAANAGLQRAIDGELFVCTAIPDSPILDATAVFYWAPIVSSLQSFASVAPSSLANPVGFSTVTC